MALEDDQQFCLKWNNFQANITSQFETLRYDEDFTDVTIACDGQRLQAHKVVLSACSPFFKELFKTNPCPHPIIFMRDVEAQHITSLMEFMYAGEVNIAQTNLSTFLKTAESLKIRGLTDTASDIHKKDTQVDCYKNSKHKTERSKQISSSTVVTSSQDVPEVLPNVSSPPPKKMCKSAPEAVSVQQDDGEDQYGFRDNQNESSGNDREKNIQPKLESPDYVVDDDDDNIGDNDISRIPGLYVSSDTRELSGGMEIIPQTSNYHEKDENYDTSLLAFKFTGKNSTENWLSNNNNQTFHLPDDSPQDSELKQKLVKIGEGIEIYEDQLRNLKWSDYRKLTRGLATILFSPAELATCSVTGQRWSRAGNGERPVKPALDRAKVQAIISYVANRFPMVEISRIKQVLAYKCKENSTAFKMKAIRYYGEQLNK
ncbi:unnamed protein product [Phyllotreta striolata]|uniref:Uncharacterized protein n=1 Tax=Phyllotreta striolata TaxID=444603 RepID=A0A9N9XNR7_PHYSR|nr:unnamed protein product [Phyllotreta striolata]